MSRSHLDRALESISASPLAIYACRRLEAGGEKRTAGQWKRRLREFDDTIIPRAVRRAADGIDRDFLPAVNG